MKDGKRMHGWGTLVPLLKVPVNKNGRNRPASRLTELISETSKSLWAPASRAATYRSIAGLPAICRFAVASKMKRGSSPLHKGEAAIIGTVSDPLLNWKQNGASLLKDQHAVASRDPIVHRERVASVYRARPAAHLDADRKRPCQFSACRAVRFRA